MTFEKALRLLDAFNNGRLGILNAPTDVELQVAILTTEAFANRIKDIATTTREIILFKDEGSLH